MKVRQIPKTIAALLLGALALHAQALQLASITPQGEVAQVRQVVIKFDEAVVPAGNPQATAPAALQCNDAAAARGTGRWINEKQWNFEFDDDLPPGLRCSVQLAPALQSLGGAAFKGNTSYRFQTGGPFVQDMRPYPGGEIDEEQTFVLRLNGPATTASLLANTWCTVDGLGERVPVRLVDVEPRAAILKALRMDKAAAKAPLRFATLACNRRLTPSAKLQLVFGKGVVSPAPAGTAPGDMPTSVERRYGFQVREPFEASFSCERENAQAACLPVRPMQLVFNAPVAQAIAAGIRLNAAGTSAIAPSFDAPGRGAGDDGLVNQIVFKGPFSEGAQYSLSLPADFKDVAGRALRNAGSFPLRVATGAMPPLAKFAAAPFGIVERFGEPDGAVLLPVTLRKVESAPKGTVRDLLLASDADIIAWYQRVQRYDAGMVSRRLASAEVQASLPAPTGDNDKDQVQSRMVSLLQGRPAVRNLALPQAVAGDPRPFEVVGIPLTPGFHVVEIASPLLGAALLDPAHGTPRTMYVRSSALVTNLAVHFKLGRENALAWVTTLDKGKPVAQARVRVSDCKGREVASAVSDAQGIAQFTGVPPQPPDCSGDDVYTRAYFVSARAQQPSAEGSNATIEDMAFTWSDWQRGIEPWRFNVPTSQEPQADLRAHTILDRPLLRVGETVSMKHILRTETRQGFGLADAPPTTLLITHVGSGQQTTQPLAWRRTATGGQSAQSSVALPTGSKLGLYQIALGDAKGDRSIATGEFRVEAFRLPVMRGSVAPGGGNNALVNPKVLPVDVQLNYVQGGPAVNLPVKVSALVREKYLHYDDYDRFNFSPPRAVTETPAGDEEEDTATQNQQVVAYKLPLTLDRNGTGNVKLDKLPPTTAPRELLLEAAYADPNGEIQTLRGTHALWPASVVAGIQAEDWVSAGRTLRVQALALDLNGKALAGVPLEVRGNARITTSSRKRLVGGFYAYDNRTELRDLGVLCSGKSDVRGLLLCDAAMAQAGEVELVVSAKDAAGNTARAATSAYVTRQGELWFGGENHDRMDVLPEQRSYQGGDTARLQVRMPFRQATALVAVEREGVIDTRVVELRGSDPTIELKVQEGWGPNVYVSVLALRGRLREVPWYSFFTWGYKAPREWWTTFWYDGKAYVAPTALVDLSKPAFRLGMAEIRVGTKSHQLDVQVKTDQASYPVRGKAQVSISVKLPNGQPAANAEVALAAVDEALLELMPNASWNLLDAMLQRRAWGVETSTAQMEIIGRRHYGRKAVPAGGGGGHSGTRELLDTLLLWNPRVVLDAKGQAQVTVPLNDALTSFRIVAVADASLGLFGTGRTTIRTSQDLQIISGLPPLVREGDNFRAQFTLRNTTAKDMQVTLQAKAAPLAPAAQSVAIPAGQAREVFWDLVAPSQTGNTPAESLAWQVEAKDTGSSARDALAFRQRLVPAVPLSVQQANLLQLDGPLALPVQNAATALPGRGGLQLNVQATLANTEGGGLPALRDWFNAYPYACLEQTASKAIGLRDPVRWQAVIAQIPGYLDADDLANYFPPGDGAANHGSDTLNAYLLAASAEAATLNPAFALPDALRTRLEQALIAFVEGRITRKFWSPQVGAGTDLDVRKLAALEALSRSGHATGRMTTSINITPNQWPTHAVIDWLNVLRRVADVPQRDKRLAEATQVLRARISQQGTRLIFSTEADDNWWWLMQNADANAARVLLLAMEDPAWKDDVGKLASGLIARQQRGTWRTTTANVWGGLALEQFSKRFESTPVTGTTQARLAASGATATANATPPTPTPTPTPTTTTGTGTGTASVDWSKPSPRSLFLPWATGSGSGISNGDLAQTLNVTHQGSGRPWLTLQALAAVARTAPFNAGYSIQRSVTPIEQANKALPAGSYTRGDVLRITLDINASADMTWAVISDAVPAGATILGSGLGRDSQIASGGETREGRAWPAYEERGFEAFRGYYEWLPKGKTSLQYTVRLNNVGDFALPPSRVEAMYAPEMFGEVPNARIKVLAPQ